MSAQSTIIKSLTSMFRSSQPVNSVVEAAQDEQQLFLASIAHLSLEEQQQRIQKRELYRRMAQRQGIMEVEQRSTHYSG